MTGIFSDDYVVFDYETGGLSHITKRPVETGVLLFKDGKVQIRHHLVHPNLDGDRDFFIEMGAMAIHHITPEMCQADGWHPKKSTEFLIAASGKWPVWTHNGVKFDFPIFVNECARYGLKPIPQTRWRDSAAIYKGWKLQKYPDQFPNLMEFMQNVLNTRRKGLMFNLPFLSASLDVGVRMIDAAGKRTDIPDDMASLEIDDYLGVSEEDRKMLEKLGAHRAAFDVVVTHGLIQWCRRNIGHMFDPSIKLTDEDLDRLEAEETRLAASTKEPKRMSLSELAQQAIDPEDEGAI